MSTIKNLAIAVILIGSACLVYVYRERLKKILASQPEEKPIKKGNMTRNAIDEVCQAFLMYADNFQGIFEPMYKASVNTISSERKKNVLMEWDIRMSNIGNIPVSLKSWWSTIIADIEDLTDDKLQERATTIMDIVFSSGIIRDNRTELTVSEETSLYYQDPDGMALTAGHNIHIETPCWYLDTTPVRILEKGFCETV